MKRSVLGSTISACVAIVLFAGGFLVGMVPLIRGTALDGHTLLGVIMIAVAVVMAERLIAVEQRRNR